jgi:hypothetical protein
MNMLSWIISRIIQFFLGDQNTQKNRLTAKEKEEGNFEGETAVKARDFEEDYNSATKMLRLRMDNSFPDNYYARLSSRTVTTYGHGEDRALAVDTMSTAIAMSLRDGATVQQAADAGAASVGI